MKTSTKKITLISLGVFIFLAFSYSAHTAFFGLYTTEHEIKAHARMAAVETTFYIAAMKVTFTEPLEEEKEDVLTKEEIQELLDEKIEEALEKEREAYVDEKDKYGSYLTSIDEWIEVGRSKTNIPLGAFAPKWVKFPERVVVAYKVDKKEITAWEKAYEQDILVISETANVSIPVAKSMVTTLRANGYSLSKTDVDETAEIELLNYGDGWDNEYPTTLKWKVGYAGEEENLITGYDPRGILEVKPLDDDKIIHVEAGYYDLKDEYKEKSEEVKRLELEKKQLEEDIEYRNERIQEFVDEALEKENIKRDISRVTWMDVKYGTVEIEYFWFVGGGTGVFLGNMTDKTGHYGRMGYRAWGQYTHDARGRNQGVILTNAHVAEQALNYQIMVSKDKEVMWIMYPGIPFVRYTQNSDHLGVPAEVLAYDQMPVLTMDFDVGIMVTSAVPNYEKHRALLGNSDKVRHGDKIIMVGNPMWTQKYLTEGVVSTFDYSLLKSGLANRWIANGMSRSSFNWVLNSDFWIDAPIGVGGTSGSGVWAMGGSEKNKVIALHNMGLMAPVSIARKEIPDTEESTVDLTKKGIEAENDTLLSIVAKDNGKKIFNDFDFKDAKFTVSMDQFKKDNPSIEAIEMCDGYTDVAGMSGAIPINKIKAYLQERGLDPNHFGWEELSDDYWVK